MLLITFPVRDPNEPSLATIASWEGEHPKKYTLQTTLPETNIAGWKIHHFDGMKPRKDVIFMGVCC